MSAQDSSDFLTTSQLRKLRDIFEAATEQEPAQRASFIERACEGNAALKSEVELLLAAHSSDATWLDTPLPARSEISVAWEGRAVGPYRIVRQIGSGGMATVFLAERQIGKTVKPVALKVVRPGYTANQEMMRRFEREREVLASLDHPNIARLLDVGSTTDGIPYLVMDHVEGERIDLYCENRKLTVEKRLDLFRTACAAIQYAHDRGVVHRDLKPANILITAGGVLKLLDFGIAKVLREEGQTGTAMTQAGLAPMTIEYASPEQVLGETVGPASDVYSLGVLLYELLTGARPYQTEGLMMHAVAKVICEEPPITPSSANIPEGLRRRLSGDLDAILLKALRKEPVWRYASATDFSEDIRLHLAGQRVMARNDTMRYRMERVVRRVLFPSNDKFHTQGMMMFTAGLLGVGLLWERQDILSGVKQKANVAVDVSVLTVWLCWAMTQGRRMSRVGKFSALDRQSWLVFTVITIVLGVLTIVSELRPVITPEPMAIFWNAGLAIGLLIVGFQASRILTAGGIAMFASAVIASFFPRYQYFCLAAGILAGMVIPGIVLALQGISIRGKLTLRS